MKKRLIVYDMDEDSGVSFPQRSGDTFFSASPPVRHCAGCFGCWIKTPGRCVIEDRCSELPICLSQSDEMILISPVLYGGFSVNIKKILERCIAYILPYQRLVNGEMHHTMRYDNPFRLSACFYGPCDDEERGIAERLVAANALNMGAGSYTVRFFESVSQAKEVLC